MVRLRDQYDWVVLGDHPGALLSACLVARLGLSVLVLSFGARMKPQITKTGQVLDPEPNFLLGIARAERNFGLFLDCLVKMGMLPHEHDRIRSAGIMPQVVTPRFRLTASVDTEELKEELRREFGKDSPHARGLLGALNQSEDATLGYWKKFPERLTVLPQGKDRVRKISPGPMSFDELKRKIRQSASGLSKSEKLWLSEQAPSVLQDPELVEVCEALWYGFTSLSESRFSLLELVSLLALARTGGAFEGGMSALREMLLGMAKRLGAQVLDQSECRRIFVSDGRLIGIQIQNRGNVIATNGGILGCSLDHAKEHVSLSGKKWFHRLKPAPRPKGWRFTVSLTVRAEAIPPGVQSRLVWKEQGAPVLDIEIANPKDYGIAEPDNRFIFLRTLLPFEQRSFDGAYQRMVAARMFRQLAEIMPFVEFHVLRIHPDFRAGSDSNEAGDGVWQNLFSFKRLNDVPENIRMIDGEGVGSRSGIEGLFVATSESFPRLGALGGALAALEASAWIAHRSGLPGPLD